MARTRGARGGAETYLRPYRVAVGILLAVGVMVLLVELQSPSLIFWTGERVQGTNEGGIIYYTVGGDNRTLNDPREPPPHPVPVTVYADPDDASRDRSSNLARGLDAVFVLSPFVGAAAVLVVGLVRRDRFRRRAEAAGPLPPVRPSGDGPPPSRSSPSR